MAADKSRTFVIFVLFLIGTGVCIFTINQIARRGYEALSYDQVVASEFSSKADYAEIVARNTIEIGFLQGTKKTRLTLHQLFFSNEKLKGLDCKEKVGRYKCYQFIDLKKGDRIFKNKGEKVLCTGRACYVLVAEGKKADLGD